MAAPTDEPLACARCCILRLSWRPVPGSRLAAASPACAGCLPPAYFRSLSPSAESWLVFRLAPDSSSLARLSCDPESHRMPGLCACGLNPSACAAESLSQACGELSTSTGPCIVSGAADEYPAFAVHCTSGSPVADLPALAFCRIHWLRQLHLTFQLSLVRPLLARLFDQCVDSHRRLNLFAWLSACLRLSPVACFHPSGFQHPTPY